MNKGREEAREMERRKKNRRGRKEGRKEGRTQERKEWGRREGRKKQGENEGRKERVRICGILSTPRTDSVTWYSPYFQQRFVNVNWLPFYHERKVTGILWKYWDRMNRMLQWRSSHKFLLLLLLLLSCRRCCRCCLCGCCHCCCCRCGCCRYCLCGFCCCCFVVVVVIFVVFVVVDVVPVADVAAVVVVVVVTAAVVHVVVVSAAIVPVVVPAVPGVIVLPGYQMLSVYFAEPSPRAPLLWKQGWKTDNSLPTGSPLRVFLGGKQRAEKVGRVMKRRGNTSLFDSLQFPACAAVKTKQRAFGQTRQIMKRLPVLKLCTTSEQHVHFSFHRITKPKIIPDPSPPPFPPVQFRSGTPIALPTTRGRNIDGGDEEHAKTLSISWNFVSVGAVTAWPLHWPHMKTW